mmetsp:Transcript_95130/g.193503  ORF Transcript_95130/g.193503 Transcript_95130/m.193503 type:complete len:213 (-) Transcript_95130:82-720(-)
MVFVKNRVYLAFQDHLDGSIVSDRHVKTLIGLNERVDRRERIRGNLVFFLRIVCILRIERRGIIIFARWAASVSDLMTPTARLCCCCCCCRCCKSCFVLKRWKPKRRRFCCRPRRCFAYLVRVTSMVALSASCNRGRRLYRSTGNVISRPLQSSFSCRQLDLFHDDWFRWHFWHIIDCSPHLVPPLLSLFVTYRMLFNVGGVLTTPKSPGEQ